MQKFYGESKSVAKLNRSNTDFLAVCCSLHVASPSFAQTQ